MAEAETLTRRNGIPEIRLIISDFGGVICTFDYRIFCDRLARRTGRTTDQVFAAAFGDNLQRAFETGRLSGPEYHRAIMNRLQVDVPYDEFFPMYGDIFTEIPATCDLLRRLHGRYLLYLLSDTNEIHFGYVRERVGILRVFREFIVSYQVGAMKPDPRIYQEALRRSGMAPTACVFVDDRPGNVEGAARLGMHAVLFQSPEQCAAELTRLGVVIP
jgi:putative hydrolase of the HAD superfamily